jgi:uncharacterized protein (TIGR03067 family)
MRLSPVILLLCCSIIVADEAKKQEALKADLKLLEGTWEGFAVMGKGERPNEGPVHVRITITDGKISAVDLNNKEKDMGMGSFKIDPTKAVKEIDATGIVLPGKRERTFLGIYEVDKETLRWCVDNRQKDRPTQFETVKGNYLLVLKRKK